MNEVFTITEDDYFAYQWHLFKHNPTAKRSMTIQMLTPIAVFVAIAIFYMATKKPVKSLYPLAVAMILWPFLYRTFFYRSMKKKLRKLIRKMEKDLPMGEHRVAITDSGIADGDVAFAYDDIRSVIANENFLYIFYKDAGQAYLLPKNLANEKINSYIGSKNKKG